MAKKRRELMARAAELRAKKWAWTRIASEIGVNAATLWRWTRTAEWAELYERARQEFQSEMAASVVASAQKMLALADVALAALREAMDGGDTSLKVRAADIVLKHFSGLVDQVSTIERIEELERRVAEIDEGQNSEN